MSNKVKAALIVFGFIVSSSVLAVAVDFIAKNVDIQTIFNCIMAGLFGFIIYTLYTIVLNRLDYQDTIKNTKNG